MQANTGNPNTTGIDIRGRFAPPSQTMPTVTAISSVAEPKSGCASSSSATSPIATPSGLSTPARWR